jgi:hypothetical protein
MLSEKIRAEINDKEFEFNKDYLDFLKSILVDVEKLEIKNFELKKAMIRDVIEY